MVVKYKFVSHVMKIIVDKDIPFALDFFSHIGEIVSVIGREIDSTIVHDADILVVRTITPVNETLLQNSQIKFVGSATSGIDHIDQQYLQDKNIGFAHAPGSNAISVAEYVLSSLLVLADQEGFDLTSKSVGIVGCGHVGSRLSGFIKSIGMQAIEYDPPLQELTGDGRYRQLSELLQADIISLHVPLVDNGARPTIAMVNQEFLGYLKSNVILVNSSRGAVIDEAALQVFLKQNSQARVILDVWDNEPEINIELISLAAISTPHIAGYSMDGKQAASKTVFMQACEYFEIDIDGSVVESFYDTDISEISITEYTDTVEAIQMTVLASYDVRSDSAAFRQILELDKRQRATFFDKLRSNYPARREFDATKIKLNIKDKVLQESLTKLGFQVSLS